MAYEMPPDTRSKLPLRRFLAAALSGGLGVFGLAVDSSAATKSASPTAPPASVASADPQGD
jgi:hypothetical protein